MFGLADTPPQQRFDQTTLLCLAVSGGLLLLPQIKAFTFGQLKIEMLERLRKRQVKQEEKIDYIRLMLPLLLPEKEIKLLKNLGSGAPAKFRGSHEFKGQLRRLRSMGLIANRPDRKVTDIKDGTEIELGDYMELTRLGKQWLSRIQEMEEVVDTGADAGGKEKS
jgi:hypothetical protein